MFGKEKFMRIAGLRCNPVTKSSLAPRLNRSANTFAGAVLMAFLGGCGSSLPFLSEDPAVQPVTIRKSHTVTASELKRMRSITAQDILNEWSTFGLETKPDRRGLASRMARARGKIPPHDHPGLTVQEIIKNTICHSCEQKPYHEMVTHASRLHGVPASLIHAIIQKESSYNPSAISRNHARGLMQITPDTGRFMGVENSQRLYDPQTNINVGVAYLKYLMRNHDTIDEVLAAYNAGPGNVLKYNGVPPFRETRHYVHDVKEFYSAAIRE